MYLGFSKNKKNLKLSCFTK